MIDTFYYHCALGVSSTTTLILNSLSDPEANNTAKGNPAMLFDRDVFAITIVTGSGGNT